MTPLQTIQAAVGQGGANRAADVKLVQLLLNNWLRSNGKPALAVDGLAGPKTQAGIRDFQRSFGGVVDGRVDPRGATITALAELQFQLLQEGGNLTVLQAARARMANPQTLAGAAGEVDLAAALNELLRGRTGG